MTLFLPFLSPHASMAFEPSTSAIGGSVLLSALIGLLPLVLFFVLLGVLKLATHWCALGALALSALIAWLGFGMPLPLIGGSALYGIAFGITPIVFIVIAAVWLYNLTVSSRRAEDVRAVFSIVGKGDIRIQALLLAFSFCGLLEGLAGFGAPVAIVAAMLFSLGVPPIKAALATMVGNAVSVCFGAMAIPLATAGRIGGLGDTGGALVAHAASSITPYICVFIPFALLFILDGMRAIKQLWHVALIQGVVTALGQFVAAHFISYELTAVFASLLGFAVTALVLTVITPVTPQEWASQADSAQRPSAARIALGLMPYWLVVIIFGIAKLWRIGADIPALLAQTTVTFPWPGLYGELVKNGQPNADAMFSLQTLANPGTMIVITAIIVSIVYGATSSGGRYPYTFLKGMKELLNTIYTLRWSLTTIALVMSLAYVMNFSGQTSAIGAALAATGAAFGFLSPILGWIGTAVTGSATSSNALFASMQTTASAGIGFSDPSTFLAANSIGGGLGKIVSPQNLAIASTAINQPGCESELLRKAAPWSGGLLLVLCILTFLATQGIVPIF